MIRSVDVSGSLPSVEVRRSIERATDGFRDCYRTAARAASRTPGGTVRVTLEIDESGMVRNVSATGAPLPGLAACVQQTTSRLRSRLTPDVGVVHASVVLAFAPVMP